MNEHDDLADLIATTERIVADAEERGLAADRWWPVIAAAGLTRLAVPEDGGGSGGNLTHLAAVTEVLSRHGLHLPFVESAWLGAWLLSCAGLPLPDGPVAAVADRGADLEVERDATGGWTVRGSLQRVPWAQDSEQTAVLTRAGGALAVVALTADQSVVTASGANLAGEPWADLEVGCDLDGDCVALVGSDADVSFDSFRDRGLVGRVVAMSAAARGVLQIAVQAATQREQFGRPVGRFQAVQHHLANLAAETVAMEVAARSAVLALARGDADSTFAAAAAAAAATASESAGVVAALGHQICGAIGITEEHPLHGLTTHLWAWRDIDGGEVAQHLRIGEQALGARGSAWDLVVGNP